MTSEEYHKIDYLIMEKAFAIHNKYGRFQVESTYRNELAYQIQKSGLSVATEVPLKIENGSFTKNCFMDLIVNGAIIYELKAKDAICNHSRSQILNYQFISELVFGKLINFRAASVEHEFSTTTVTKPTRCNVKITDINFSPFSSGSSEFYALFENLLTSRGTHLALDLYQQAMVHLPGGVNEVQAQVNVLSADRVIGAKKIHQVSSGEAFKITGVSNPLTMPATSSAIPC